MRARAAFSMVVAIGLAGCIAAEPATVAEGVSLAEADEIDPASEFGIVQGTVVSDETVPLANAQVGLQGTAFVGLTDVAGQFSLRDVPPGKYVLFVGALGHESTARSIEVLAAQITQVTVALASIEVREVYYSILHFTGFFDCALATQTWISMCTYPYTAVEGSLNKSGVGVLPDDLQANNFRFNMTIGKDIGQVVAEVVWTPSSAAATRLLFLLLCGDYDPVPDDCTESLRYTKSPYPQGESPIRAQIEGETIIKEGEGSVKYDLTKQDQIWVMNYVGLPFGSPQVAFQQKFEVWDTLFYNGPGPEGWSVLNDA
jgi:hypothetical protein